jgi:hypothetical protein
MIIVKNEGAVVLIVAPAADAQITRAQITISHVDWQSRLFALDDLAAPRPVLPAPGYDDLFFA